MNLARLYHTLKPLRAVQWTDRLIRPVKAGLLRERVPAERNPEAARGMVPASMPRFPTSDVFDPLTGEATLLNLPHRFSVENIDWNFSGHGKLWAYHLNYFGWLDRLHDEEAVREVMRNFCQRTGPKSIGAEIYPTSRRIQHWIGAVQRFGLRDDEILTRLYADAWRVARLPEYHLQVNHLLQNGLAMFSAAIFFDDEKLQDRASSLLSVELRKQFLPDGCHIERSASYTADLCGRMICGLHLQRSANRQANEEVWGRMRNTVTGTLSWLKAYAFSDGSFAHIGDSSADMMPAVEALTEAAKLLGIFPKNLELDDSGYRKASGHNWEAIFNVGTPAPPYQPGHSHADALTFCIHAHGKPLIVDAGISTYERSERRVWERSTEAHNTVVVNGENSSDVWASFRMGKRAEVFIRTEKPGYVYANHNGYNWPSHGRAFDWKDDRIFRVKDAAVVADFHDDDVLPTTYTTYLHFHPDVILTGGTGDVWHADGCKIEFSGFGRVSVEQYQWAAGFNLLRPAVRLRCEWRAMETEIQFRF